MGCCILRIQYIKVLDETTCLNSRNKYMNYGRCGKVWIYAVYNDDLFSVPHSQRNWGRLCLHPIAPRVWMESCLPPSRNAPLCSGIPTRFPPGFCTVIKRTTIFSRSNLKKPKHFVVQSPGERSRWCSWQSRAMLPSPEALRGY